MWQRSSLQYSVALICPCKSGLKFGTGLLKGDCDGESSKENVHERVGKIPDGQKDGQKTCSERDQGRFEKRTSHGPQGNEEIRQEV